MWSKIKKWLGPESARAADPSPSELSAPVPSPTQSPAASVQSPSRDLSSRTPEWIAASDSPFGVRVLDVRPITLGTFSATKDPAQAKNAQSYGGEDGRAFADERPAIERSVHVGLQFRAPERLVDGALFIPTEMEDKWALFVQRGELLLVRSWHRKVFLRAAMHVQGAELHIGAAYGAVISKDESEEFTRRALDFVLRACVLRQPWPAPLLASPDTDPHTLAIQCMSLFGRHAHFASLEVPPRDLPAEPLRVMNRLHFAVIDNDVEAARQAIGDGFPTTLENGFGFRPIHHVKAPGPLLELLLASGAHLDDATGEGATLLMLATQDRNAAMVSALLERGASADAVDARGFSALHRAAEMGEVEIVSALLAHGADPDRAARGAITPRSLASKRNETRVLALLSAPSGSS